MSVRLKELRKVATDDEAALLDRLELKAKQQNEARVVLGGLGRSLLEALGFGMLVWLAYDWLLRPILA